MKYLVCDFSAILKTGKQSLFVSHTLINLPLGRWAAHSPAHSRSRAARKSCSDDRPHPSQPDGNTEKHQIWRTWSVIDIITTVLTVVWWEQCLQQSYSYSWWVIHISTPYTMTVLLMWHKSTWMASLVLWRHLLMAPRSRFFRPAHEASSIPCRTTTTRTQVSYAQWRQEQTQTSSNSL